MVLRRMEEENEQRRDRGLRTLERKNIYERLDVARSTFGDWTTKGIMPDDYLLLVEVLVDLLPGNQTDWHAHCKNADRAYQVYKNAVARRRLETASDVSSHESGSTQPDAAADRHFSGGMNQEAERVGSANADETGTPGSVPRSTPPTGYVDGGQEPVVGGSLRKRVLFTGAITAGAAAGVVVVALLLHGTSPAGTRENAGSASSSTSSRSALCAYVVEEPAEVYNAPDTSSGVLRKKPINSGITVLDLPHPPGWTAVSTPFDAPGFKWMQTADLSAPYNGPHPCQDHPMTAQSSQ